ncbi:hypothetical protein [Treponema pedis]|uniref:Uncharacterized protein n=2 Tax=Treponema pedis TaxID=409322 RepID=S6A044_9SPIR|nr:hypothetical protein [Treponema pedis]AGT44023.1 hypothetical protein TPE_1528 [Treponema pedis str. T A4]QOW61862.1 hypothetical protein IFE08_05730 [Treponema pedis]QSI04749.1 hypothetical protein DYQ05_07265 [Treponema pedis]
MKKKIIISITVLSALAVFASNVIQPKTTKYTVERRSSAAIYMTEIYSSEYWTEVYLTYEEDNDKYDEAETEKEIYEFISKYKVEHKFSTVEIEDLKAAAVGEKKTTVLKRLIFRQIRK